MLDALMNPFIQQHRFQAMTGEQLTPSFHILESADEEGSCACFYVMRLTLSAQSNVKSVIFDARLCVESDSQNWDNPALFIKPVFSPLDSLPEYLTRNVHERFQVQVIPNVSTVALPTMESKLDPQQVVALKDLHFQKMRVLALIHSIAVHQVSDLGVRVKLCSNNILRDIVQGRTNQTGKVTDYFRAVFVNKTEDLHTLRKKLKYYSDKKQNGATVENTAERLRIATAVKTMVDSEKLSLQFQDNSSSGVPAPMDFCIDLPPLFPQQRTITIEYPQMFCFVVTWFKDAVSKRWKIENWKIANVETDASTTKKLHLLWKQFERKGNEAFQLNVRADNATTLYFAQS